MQGLQKIAVRVVHQNHFMAAGLAAVLADLPDIEVIGPGERMDANVQDEVTILGQPEVVIADFSNGMGLLSRRFERTDRHGDEPSKIFIVAQSDREWDVRSAISAGADGYVLQGCTSEELRAGVRALSQGARYYSSEVGCSIADSLTREELTSREKDVLELLGRGMPNKAIARALGIAEGTVKAHMKRMFGKLSATTRTQAVVFANERGLLQGQAS